MEEQQYEYRTGRTAPEKTPRILITVLLICVILLVGVVSVLSIMNVRLTRLLADATREPPPISFARGVAPAANAALHIEGMALTEADPVYQQLHELPQGLYVSAVEAGSQAQQQGILPGDVLISCDGTAIDTADALTTLKNAKKAGQSLSLVLCRDGQNLSFTLIISQ